MCIDNAIYCSKVRVMSDLQVAMKSDIALRILKVMYIIFHKLQSVESLFIVYVYTYHR